MCSLLLTFGKQFGPRSGLTKCQAWSGSKLFDILMVLILKEFFEKVSFEKKKMTKIYEKIHGMLGNVACFRLSSADFFNIFEKSVQ